MKRYMILVILATTGFLLSGVHNSQAQKFSEKFPIVACYGPDVTRTGIHTFVEMKQAGFTLYCYPDQETKSNQILLNIADSLNFGVIISDQRFKTLPEMPDTLSRCLDLISADYSSHPSLWGYLASNKPPAQFFKKIGNQQSLMIAKHPSLPILINLLPVYASPLQLGSPGYYEYIWEFIDKVNPQILYYDCYPAINGIANPEYYKNMEIIRKSSVDHHIPFWVNVYTMPFNANDAPEHSHLRVQAYSALAYGARGLAFNTYSAPDSAVWQFKSGLIDKAGNPTQAWYSSAEINSEIHQLGPVLIKLQSTGVFHSSPAPPGCSALGPDLPITQVDGESFLLGFFSYNKEKYVFIVNKNHLYGARPRLYFSNRVKKIREIARNTNKPFTFEFPNPHKEKSCTVLFKAGDGRLFRIYE